MGMIPVLLVAIACEGEQTLQRLRPLIYVCATVDSPLEECNRALDLGELPVTLPHPISLDVRNKGEGALIVSSVTSDDGLVTASNASFTVIPSGHEALDLTLAPRDVGPGVSTVEITSDDEGRSPLGIALGYVGIPKPVPRIELCLDDPRDARCGTELDVPFGAVRRSQQDSRTISVHNAGTAPLSIQEVRTEGETTIAGEFIVATSTRPGELAPGAQAPAVIVYEPRDGRADAIDVVFRSDDPITPEARLHLSASSGDNLPPIADAREIRTGSTSINAAVDDVIVLDGSMSSDLEGDPLTFRWTVLPPARSIARIDDPTAGRVSFAPDVAGDYRIELEVFDSLGQASAAVAVVLIQARPRYAFRAILEWAAGGDVDLHLIESGGSFFGPADCYFDNPNPDFGLPSVVDDDPRLIDDTVRPPGRESIVLLAPAAGSYGVYAHYFEEGSLGPAAATVSIVFDDASVPAFEDTRSLAQTCTLWHVGDVVFPDAVFTPSALPLVERCR